MKRLSSMAALGLALALTFGMTVSAAENPSGNTSGVADTVRDEMVKQYTEYSVGLSEKIGEVTTIIGDETVVLETKPVVPEALQYADKRAARTAVNKAAELKIYYVPENKDVQAVPVGAADISLPEGYSIPKGGITMTIPIAGVKEGETLILMHQLANGEWEALIPSSVADGSVTVKFTSLSPVIAYRVSLVDAEDNDKDEGAGSSDSSDAAAAPAAANPATSPKTAETLPAAGVMALICLAGAAICAGRIRYNK